MEIKNETWPEMAIADMPGQSYIKVYTDRVKITKIEFSKQRPTIEQSKVKRLKNLQSTDQDKCHIMGVEVLKQIIKTKYEGEECDDLAKEFREANKSSLFFFENISFDLQDIARKIAKEYLDKFRDINNLINGNSKNNQLSGRIVLLLKPYIENGKNLFKSCTIEIVNDAELVQFMGSNQLQISSWSTLLDYYFSANYDFFAGVNRKIKFLNTTINKANVLCEAKKTFLFAYEKFGEYDPYDTEEDYINFFLKTKLYKKLKPEILKTYLSFLKNNRSASAEKLKEDIAKLLEKYNSKSEAEDISKSKYLTI